MAYPHSHKTILVLDRGSFFEKSSQQPIDFDVFTKSRGPGLVPMPPLCKSLWTCNVEACLEFCRIVYDIHPLDRNIRIITSTPVEAKVLNSWDKHEQNTQHLMSALAHCNSNETQNNQVESSIIHGLSQAVELFCQPTKLQLAAATKADESDETVANNGRIICLTHLKGDTDVKTLQGIVQDAILVHNKSAAQNESLLLIDNCELELVHIIPVGQVVSVKLVPKYHVSQLLSVTVDVSQSGNFIAHKMVELCTTHYNLCSTTVTGIPMKEEQNASSSANYDVELLHSSNVHDDLFKSGCAEGLIIPSKEGLYLKTVTLKWCTPKSSSVELHQCTGVHRFTPVDVNSRPSSCLTNFLLNGRSVMLEQPRKTGNRVMSHMLTSHGGELYVHVLATARSTLEDPPSISEGCGGRITDYRINDFGELMKECRFAPVADTSVCTELPMERAKSHLERLTRCWPITISDTIIFNMLSHLDPLPTLIVKEQLDDEDVLECKKSIYHVVGMESRNDPLPIPQSGNRGKGPKRDEQYRQMWSELEKFIRAHSETSPLHLKILDCLLECKKPEDMKPLEMTKVKSETMKDEKPDNTVDLAWKEYDRFSKMTEREKTEWNKTDIKSPDSPPIKKMKSESIFSKCSGPQSVLSLWTSRINALQNSRCNEFVGRLESGNKAELYKHLKLDEAKVNTETSSSKNEKSKK